MSCAVQLTLGATKWLDLPDGRLAYDDTGEGPLIVATPAMLDLRSELRFLVPRLVEAGFRVVTIDQRGMGETDGVWPEYGSTPRARDPEALIRHLDSGPATIYGTSNGAAAGVYLAAGGGASSILGIIGAAIVALISAAYLARLAARGRRQADGIAGFGLTLALAITVLALQLNR